MKLTMKARYAVRIMIDIAQQKGERVPLRVIAERQEISRKFAEVIAVELRTAGLAKSIRGMRGGYLLDRPADEISIGDIVRVVDDPYEASEDPRDAAIETGIGGVQAAIWGVLDEVSLAEAAES